MSKDRGMVMSALLFVMNFKDCRIGLWNSLLAGFRKSLLPLFTGKSEQNGSNSVIQGITGNSLQSVCTM